MSKIKVACFFWDTAYIGWCIWLFETYNIMKHCQLEFNYNYYELPSVTLARRRPIARNSYSQISSPL